MKKEKIDFVILWVDGSDKEWLKEKNKYSKDKIDITNCELRYRDYGILKYWFRAVEKYTPWVNKIHFVTWGHLPKWLDTTNPKINIVNHKDFIPKKYLPTFSSHTIELNLHRIKDLEEKFVYFNDDMFILKQLESTYFFKNNLPTDMWNEDILILDKTTDLIFAHILVNVGKFVNSNFSKRNVIKNNFGKYCNFKYGKNLLKNLLLYSWRNFSPCYYTHTCNSFLKSTFEEVWKKENELLDKVCLNKFRDDNDVNQYVMKAWQIYSGNFTPKSYKHFGDCITLSDDVNLDIIKNQETDILCINDGVVKDFDKIKEKIINAFEIILPEKSTFEK